MSSFFGSGAFNLTNVTNASASSSGATNASKKSVRLELPSRQNKPAFSLDKHNNSSTNAGGMNSSTYLSSPRAGDTHTRADHYGGSGSSYLNSSGVSSSTINQSRIYGNYSGNTTHHDPMNTSTYSHLSSRFAPRNGHSVLGSPSNASHTDAVLQKARDALEAQAHDLDRERRDKIDKEKRVHDLEQELNNEKSNHYMTQTKLHE